MPPSDPSEPGSRPAKGPESSGPDRGAPIHPQVPAPLAEVAERLGQAGITAAWQGESLIAAMLNPAEDDPQQPVDGNCVVYTSDAASALKIFPQAAVTAAGAARLTLTASGTRIDLLPIGDQPLEEALPHFGLGALAFAWLFEEQRFCDPTDAVAGLGAGQLAASGPIGEASLRQAGRRLWIAARLIAEWSLEATPDLIAAGRAAVAHPETTIPSGAPARREFVRLLTAPKAGSGLAFLQQIGLSDRLFPGADPRNANVIERLPNDVALRWSAALRGSRVQESLRRLRAPAALARRVERFNRYHPIDHLTASMTEGSLRRLLKQLSEDELDVLITWRDAEIDVTGANRENMERLRKRLDRMQASVARLEGVRTLAIDGKTAMAQTGRPPGRWVGEALAHLVRFVDEDPERNEPDVLVKELLRWVAARDDPGGSSGGGGT